MQHDFDIANASGATVRADINNAIEALATLSSGATEPSTTYAYELWADTTSGLLKQRNAANGAWKVRDTLAETLAVSRGGNTILAAGDHKKFFVATSSFTQTLTAAATLGDGWYCFYRVNSGVTITFDPNSTETIDGATTLAIPGPASGIIFCDGSNFHTYGFIVPATQAQVDAGTSGKVLTADLKKRTVGTKIATTSGTEHDFAVPSGATEVTIGLVGVSISGTANLRFQLGDAGGIETSGYAGNASVELSTSITVNALSGSGFDVAINSASYVVTGEITLKLIDPATNEWLATALFNGKVAAVTHYKVSGNKALSGELTTVRLTTSNGSDTFDAGYANSSYIR